MGGWLTRGPGRFTPGNDPVPIYRGLGAPGQVWTGSENFALTGFLFQDRPPCSELLYRLRCSGPQSFTVPLSNKVYVVVLSNSHTKIRGAVNKFPD